MARPRSLAVIAAEGDQLKTLEALRDKLARRLDSPKTAPRDFAALTRHFVQVGKEIESLKVRAATAKNSAGIADESTCANPVADAPSEAMTPIQELSAAVKAKRMRIVPAS
ncbi:hypothetical protein R4P64_07775 [Rhodococcus sp. IEGM 1366]|uniref:hypothetical protein n=1 Tax=Rhodococcus sp. IEGM 1366 TaxID=3082223 RepID=UPI002952A928|nr:hypothetical protein [Rhodococcus sp. IEGM 1366]MDV8066400.1 hypothetical protein [Rhodococcus sp. IEGM 1366]